MPQILQTIPAISRAKKQDVLFVTFRECDRMMDRDDDSEKEILEYKDYHKRNELLQFLDKYNIKHKPAFAYEFYGFYAYDGCLYIDIEFDANLSDDKQGLKYIILNDHLMDGDKQRDKDVTFYHLRYKNALVNAEFDEPGFWDDF